MAKSWIDDAWLRDSVDANGNRIPPTAAMRRAAGTDPEKAKRVIPPEHRTARYGKGSRWVVYWTAPDGRHRKAFGNRADAEAFRADMEDDIRSGRYIDPRGGERTVADAYREWIGTLVNVKESTAAGYERAYRTTIGPKWADTPLGAIDRGMITAWVRDLLDGNAPGPLKGPLAPSTAAQRLFVLTMILEHAVRTRLIPANPASGIRARHTVDARPLSDRRSDPPDRRRRRNARLAPRAAHRIAPRPDHDPPASLHGAPRRRARRPSRRRRPLPVAPHPHHPDGHAAARWPAGRGHPEERAEPSRAHPRVPAP